MPSRRIISKKLKNLIQEINDEYPYLNCGGCGAFAYLLAEQLDQYKIPYTFLVWDASFVAKDGDNSTEIWKPITKDRLRKYFLTARHVTIKINRTIYNDICEGYYSKAYIYIPQELNGYIKRNLVESIGFNRRCWNWDFDLDDLWKIRNKLNNKFLSCTEQL